MTDGGNGNFRAGFMPTTAGKYFVQILSEGATPDGQEFLRTAEHSFEVADSLKINESAKTRLIDDLRWQINLPIDNLKTGQRVIAYAEVWANEQPVAWIGGMTSAERFDKRYQSVSLTLDSRWLARSASTGNYELRNVRLQDAETSVVLAKAEKISLPEFPFPNRRGISAAKSRTKCGRACDRKSQPTMRSAEN